MSQKGRSEKHFFRTILNAFTDVFRNYQKRNERFIALPHLPQDGSPDTRSVAHEFAVDAKHRILDLGDARMANIVGITLTALTSDGYVLFVRQTSRNSVLPKGIAASSSGSLDWIDAKKTQQAAADDEPAVLRDVLFMGMLRELLEESQVSPDEVIADSQRVTGYFRWLSRGAKPEFTGIVRLNVDLATLERRRVSGVEKNYTEGRLAVPVRGLLDAAGSWTSPQEALYTALYDVLGMPLSKDGTRQVPVGVSSIASWCAAADFLAAHPHYLSDASTGQQQVS